MRASVFEDKGYCSSSTVKNSETQPLSSRAKADIVLCLRRQRTRVQWQVWFTHSCIRLQPESPHTSPADSLTPCGRSLTQSVEQALPFSRSLCLQFQIIPVTGQPVIQSPVSLSPSHRYRSAGHPVTGQPVTSPTAALNASAVRANSSSPWAVEMYRLPPSICETPYSSIRSSMARCVSLSAPSTVGQSPT